MPDALQSPTNPKWMLWTGRVISALPVLGLLMSATFKFIPMEVMDKQLAGIGWTVDQMLMLGIIEVACTLLYVIPQTSVLGAILLTGYDGGDCHACPRGGCLVRAGQLRRARLVRSFSA